MDFEGAFFNTSDYVKTKTKIGSGAFGEVYLVKRASDNKVFAVKIIPGYHFREVKEQLLLIRESSILAKLNHPAIVKFYGINFHSFKDPSKLKPTFLTEYLKNGSLTEILKTEQSGIADHDWNATKKFICILGISSAMRYLHKNHIIHRDLKPDNILIDDNFYPRVCDFGMSRFFNEKMKDLQLTRVGTPLYMAPEVLFLESTYEYKDGYASDVYSFAMLTYCIIAGCDPFSEDGKEANYAILNSKLTNKQRPVFTDNFTEPMKDLISKCWKENPRDRPTFKEIFEILSSNCSSFSLESIDEDEVNSYLGFLEEEEESSFKKKKLINKLKKIHKTDEGEVKNVDDKNAKKVVEEDAEKVVEEDDKIDDEDDDKIDDEDDDKKADEDDIQLANSENSVKLKKEETLKNKLKETFLSKLNKSIDEHQEAKTKNETKNELKSETKNETNNVEFIIGNQSETIKPFFTLIKEFLENYDSIEDFHIKSVGGNLLHLACKLGNVNLFHYIYSLNKFDIKSKTILKSILNNISIKNVIKFFFNEFTEFFN